MPDQENSPKTMDQLLDEFNVLDIEDSNYEEKKQDLLEQMKIRSDQDNIGLENNNQALAEAQESADQKDAEIHEAYMEKIRKANGLFHKMAKLQTKIFEELYARGILGAKFSNIDILEIGKELKTLFKKGTAEYTNESNTPDQKINGLESAISDMENIAKTHKIKIRSENED